MVSAEDVSGLLVGKLVKNEGFGDCGVCEKGLLEVLKVLMESVVVVRWRCMGVSRLRLA
jgi:hypothetical protein